MGARLRILVVTNLFPNNLDPGFAPFNRQQLAELGRRAEVEVAAVVPWRYGRYYGGARSSAGVAREEVIDGLRVSHPRFGSLPGLPSLSAGLLAAALLPRLARRRWRRAPDVLLASYAYPDGCAGVLLGELLRLPVVVKCHGSDLNRVPDDLAARLQLRALLPRARAVVVVSRTLGERARALGVPPERLHVVYNGVDLRRFRPLDRAAARARLGLAAARPLVVSVGHLAPHKGTLDLLEAARTLARRVPSAVVVFVGDGPLAEAVTAAAGRGDGRPGNVVAVGRVAHAAVADWMAAADVVCLPSWDEGLPNVVREAHAAGRPVVATAVGGVPEAMASPELGRMVPPRDPDALAAALGEVLLAPHVAPEVIVARARVVGWGESAAALLEVLRRAAG